MKISEIKLSVIIHEWESYDKIKEKFFELLKSLDFKKLEIFENRGEGLISANLYYISAKIKGKENIKKFFRNLFDKGLKIEDLLEEIKFDENFNVYVRLDKYMLLEDDRVVPLYGEETLQLKISIDGYKKDEKKVKKFLKEYLEEISNL